MTRQTLEPKPSRDVVDQIFLSPRVLDKAAFEELSTIARQLIERAAEATKALHASAAQAEQVHQRLAEAAPIIESRLTGAGAAITTLDARTAEVRAALIKAAECAARAENAQAQAELIATQGAAKVEARLAAATESGQNTLENVRAAVEVRAREIAETALRAIEAAGQRLEDLETQTSARLTDVVEHATQSINDLEARLNQLTGRIATLAGAGLGGIAALCDRATAILGYDPSAPQPAAPSPGSLGERVQKAEVAPEPMPKWATQPGPSFDPTEPLTGGHDIVPARKRRSRSARPAKARRSARKR